MSLSNQLNSKGRPAWLPYVSGVVVISALVIALSALAVWREAQRYQERAEVTTQNLAFLLASNISDLFDKTDVLIQSVVLYYRDSLAHGGLDSARFTDYLEQQLLLVPEVFNLRVTDAEGILRFGTGAITPVSLADREFFIRARDDPASGLLIDGPLVARTTGQWVLILARRLTRPDGAFAGVINAQLSTETLGRQFSQLDLGMSGLANLRAADMAQVARYPEVAGPDTGIGNRNVSPQLKAMLKQDPQRGTFVAVSPLDGVERTLSYQKLANYPFYIIVGRATSDFFAGWRQNALLLLGFSVLIILVTTFAAWRLFRAAQRLREAEARWSFALEGSAQGVWDWDIIGQTAYYSPHYKRLLGHEEHEMGASDKEWSGRIHPDDYAAALAACEQHFRGETPYYSAEMRMRQKDGHYLWTLSRGMVVERTPAGQPKRMIGTMADISALKEAEERLRRSEERLRLATDGADVGIYYWDIPAHTLEWSERCQVHLALPPGQEPSFEHWYAVMHPDDRERIERLLRHSLENHEDIANEYRIIHPDGSPHWIRALGRFYVSADGVLTGMGGVTLDITARKQMEEQLRASGETARRQLAEIQAYYDTAPVGLLVLDTELRFLRLNQRLAEINGHSIAAHLGRTVREMVPDLADLAEPLLRNIIATGEPVRNLELTGETPAQPGIPRVWREHYYPLKDPTGQVIGLNGVVEDITEQRALENQIRQMNANLERQVAERTAQLQAATEAKSQFLASMSHEIRTPMNAVIGLAQMLEQEPLTPEQAEMIQRIRAAGNSLLGIINDILDFSKIEAGQISIEQQPFRLTAVLQHLNNLIGEMARGKGLGWRIEDTAPVRGRLLGDALRLEQILLNLTGNAIKFTEHGEVVIRVSPIAITEAAARLRFEIQDTGIGMAPEALSSLFQPFTQADGSITRRFGGTGLGLAISRRLVELMGGTIGVDSTAGVGSTFWFELPFARTLEETTAAETPRVAGPRLSRLRFLVAEDNAINRFLAERALQKEGAEITLAEDGQQALERLRQDPEGYDAVLMDVQMPVMDGLTAARAIREELQLTRLPIIALSAGVLAEERRRALAAGMNDFLPKPLELNQMAAMIRQYCPSPVMAAMAAS